MHACIYICIYVNIHTYIFAYIHTYMHACIHTYINTYIHAYIHACMHACIHTPPPARLAYARSLSTRMRARTRAHSAHAACTYNGPFMPANVHTHAYTQHAR